MNKEIMKVKIKQGTRTQLAEMFGVTTRTVSKAANGKSNTPMAQKIRVAAVDMGGDAIYN